MPWRALLSLTSYCLSAPGALPLHIRPAAVRSQLHSLHPAARRRLTYLCIYSYVTGSLLSCTGLWLQNDFLPRGGEMLDHMAGAQEGCQGSPSHPPPPTHGTGDGRREREYEHCRGAQGKGSCGTRADGGMNKVITGDRRKGGGTNISRGHKGGEHVHRGGQGGKGILFDRGGEREYGREHRGRCIGHILATAKFDGACLAAMGAHRSRGTRMHGACRLAIRPTDEPWLARPVARNCGLPGQVVATILMASPAGSEGS